MEPIAHFMEVARQAAEAAGQAALRHHRGPLQVETKGDATPVTVADREAEAAARAVIHRSFPEHAILGEEDGQTGTGSHRWILDPIDGTRGFIRGGEFWGPVVALEVHGEVLAGAVALPARAEMFWAGAGLGCHGPAGPCRVSQVERLDAACISVGELPALLRAWPDVVEAVFREAGSVRCFGDLAAAIEVLRGRADLWLEAGVQAWDIAPMGLLIREAGGQCSPLGGRDHPFDGTAVGGTPALWEMIRARYPGS